MTDEDNGVGDRTSWAEPLIAFAAVVVGLIAVTAVGTVWAPLGRNAVVVAAALFLFVPFFILRRKDADFRHFGIDLEEIPLRHVGLALLVTAVVFPLFALGNHVWETQVLERELKLSADHYRQWPAELELPPVDPDEETVHVRTSANRLFVEWHDPAPSSATLSTEGDRFFIWRATGNLTVDEGAEEYQWLARSRDTGAKGTLLLSPADQTGRASMPKQLELQVLTAADKKPPEVIVGARAQKPEEPIELRRSYWWLLLWGLTHLLLIALPEEYFYRGYLQTRFRDLFEVDGQTRRFLGFSLANWLTSALFAVGHVLIPVGGVLSPARGAVFFPSLLFGWLRDRTGSIIAPTIFHGAANMMVLVVGVHYF